MTAVHKANIMKFTDGLFLQSVKDVAKEYEGKLNSATALLTICACN